MGKIELAIGAVIAFLVVGLTIVIVWAIKDQNKWENDCHKKGGHVNSHSEWEPVVVYQNGQTTTQIQQQTTYLCLTPDGRVLGTH